MNFFWSKSGKLVPHTLAFFPHSCFFPTLLLFFAHRVLTLEWEYSIFQVRFLAPVLSTVASSFFHALFSHESVENEHKTVERRARKRAGMTFLELQTVELNARKKKFHTPGAWKKAGVCGKIFPRTPAFFSSYTYSLKKKLWCVEKFFHAPQLFFLFFSLQKPQNI